MIAFKHDTQSSAGSFRSTRANEKVGQATRTQVARS